MSYQFEDESALEELLNQQLDRRKSQAQGRSATSSGAPSRPGTSTGGPRQVTQLASQFRPSTATSSSRATSRPFVEATRGPPSLAALEAADGPPRSKLSAWLEGDSGISTASKRNDIEEPLDREKRQNASLSTGLFQPQRGQEPARVGSTRRSSWQITSDKKVRSDNNKNNDTEDDDNIDDNVNDDTDNLSSLLTPDQLQEMTKQRLVQLILERVAPKLASLARVASKRSARELQRLTCEIQAERARQQVMEMRHEEQLRLEQQKATQISEHLESRLEISERELAKLVDGQREHLEKLDEQHKRNLASLSESYEQRLREERSRFEEALKARDEMHRLEMDSRLGVGSQLTKLDTIQAEWRQTLEATIGQLEAHFKSVESVLDKQTLQVRGTNVHLAAKTKELCDQYDKLDQCNRQLTGVAKQAGELLPELANSQRLTQTQGERTNRLLASLDEKLELIGSRERSLDCARAHVESERAKLDEAKLKLALDSARVEMKEERLEEMLRTNGERECALTAERAALLEQTGQAQIKRVSLDERAADLKEQNYTLHLLRKRLTHQREELLRAQVSLVEERRVLKSERSHAAAESKRLATLRARVQREMEQLGRLQRSLVCSLCLGRLFGANGEAAIGHTLGGLHPVDSARAPYDEGQLFQRLARDDETTGHEDGRVMAFGGGGAVATAGKQKTMPTNVDHRVQCEPAPVVASDNGNDLELELRRTELESKRLAAESRYVEQLQLAG